MSKKHRGKLITGEVWMRAGEAFVREKKREMHCKNGGINIAYH